MKTARTKTSTVAMAAEGYDLNHNGVEREEKPA
jgi:hypothetical protein